MKINFITLFPDLIQSYLAAGLLGRAQTNQLMNFQIHNLRDEAIGNYKSVDDTVYGGGDGALIQYEPLKKSLDKIDRVQNSKVIYLSPQGVPLSQKLIKELKKSEQLILIAGRYAGIDQRFISKHIDLEISIGDYILSGGELASLVLVEALSREIPGVLGNSQSAVSDSFSNDLLEAPQFTKPSEIDGMQVPEVLLSGDHGKISIWKHAISVLVTLKKREDLIQNKTDLDWKKIEKFYSEISDSDKELFQIQGLSEALKKYGQKG